MHAVALVWLLIALAGCFQAYQAPAVSAPLFKEAHDLHMGLYAGTNGVDVTLGYAPIERVGLVARISDSAFDHDSKFEEGGSFHEHTYGEIGAGYFSYDGGDHAFEVLGGAGYGYSAAQEGADGADWRASGHYARPFVQADWGYVMSSAELGLTLRGAYVLYSFSAGRFRGDRHQQRLFLEPAVFWRVGWQTVKIEVQAGAVLPTGSESIDSSATDLRGNELRVSLAVGLHLDFSSLWYE